jgi:hypothetical protein
MLLSEFVDLFRERYKLECFKRNVPPQLMTDPFITILLSKAVSDTQKQLSVIEVSQSITLIVSTAKYNLNSSLMTVKNVTLSKIPLEQVSAKWIQEQIEVSGTPAKFAILYESAIPQLYLYPTPSSVGIITVNYKPNFNFYSPSSTTIGDFGDFRITTAEGFHGNTVFPTQYDELTLLGMLKQLFNDIEQEYRKEKFLLMAKQISGVGLNKYNMDGVI